MTAVQAVALVLVAASGTIVVALEDPRRQALGSGLFGISLGLLFLAFQAPDVALSQIAVGGIAVPAMILLTIAKVRRKESAAGGSDEQGRK